MYCSTESKLASLVLAVSLLTIPVACGKVQPSNLTASGVLEAIEINVGSKIPGQLLKVPVEEGQFVKEGDLVAVIDCVDIDFQVSQAKANVALAKAQLEMTITGARSEDIGQAASLDRQAVAGLDLARSDFERVKKLYETGAATKKMMDDAQARLTVSDAQKDAAKDTLKKIKKISRPEEIAMARARSDVAKAVLAAVEKKLSDCNVLSPVGGMVLSKVFEPGEMVGPSSTIVVVSNLRKLRAVVYLPEADVFRIRYGEKVRVTTDGFSDKSFEGTVSFISQKAEFTPRNVQTRDERVKLMFEVKISVENPDLILKPGLPIDVAFQQATGAKT